MPPKTPMLKVKTLLAQARSHRPVLVSNSNIVQITFGRTVAGQDAHGYYRAIQATALTNRPKKKPKRVEIRLYWPEQSGWIPEVLRPQRAGYVYSGPAKPPPFTIETDAWASCSCEYFLYHCEVADTRKGSSSIRYSNGAAPHITNPQLVSHLCKHILAALRKGALVVKK